MQQNHPQFVLESHPFHRDQCAPLFVLVEFYIILVDFCQDSRALTFIRAADLALPSRSHLASQLQEAKKNRGFRSR